MSEKTSQIKSLIYSVSVLSGTIIGVGIFSLPYIASKVGFWLILGYLLVLGFLVILIHLFFGELTLKTPDYKRLPGFAKIYLGKWGEKIAFTSTIIGSLGAMLAYILVGGEFLKELLSPFFGGNENFYILIYFALGAVFIYFGIRTISKIEFWCLILFFLVLIIVFFKIQPFLKIQNLFPAPDFKYWFLPYGPILFSLWGATLIPEIEEMLSWSKELIKKVISIGILIPIIIYIFFIYLILGATGPQTTELALIGLKDFFGNSIVPLLLFFGVLATFTSFITIGLSLNKVFHYDLKIGRVLSWFSACFIPLALFFLGLRDFIAIISFLGGVMLAIDGVLILLMYRKIKTGALRNFVFFLILILILGIIYEIAHFLNK